MFRRAGGGFRPEIEGLRAVALLAVVLYHAGVPVVSGGYVGVDVFFVVSGFLMTRLLVDEIRRTGTVSIRTFYLRRARRLLPAVALTLVAVTVLTAVFLAPTEHGQIAGDILAAALYAINWRFAEQTVDYFAGGWQASPVQHFWSLAVEEQFYLLWPVLFLGVAWAARRLARNVSRTAAGVVVVVLVASLAYAVTLTRREADVAYFSTLARGWELALGGVVALLPARPPRWLARGLAWTGLAVVVFSALWLDDDSVFPGLNALLPTLGTAAVLLAGTEGALWPLLTRPVRYVGRISYSWYLWHWPAVVLAAVWWPDLTMWQGLLAVTVAGAVSAASYRWVEVPFRRGTRFTGSPRWTVTLAAGCTSMAVVAGVVLPATTASPEVKKMSDVRGAEAIRDGDPVQERADALRPDPRQARDDRPKNYADGCHVENRRATSSSRCVYGDASSDTTVVLFGDSHAMQYFPALDDLADERGWRLVALTKSGCPPADVTVFSRPLRRAYTECDTWTENSLERIVDVERPAFVVAAGRSTYSAMPEGTRLSGEDSADALERGYVRTLRRLADAGIDVRVVDDNPHPDKDIPSCVSENLDRLKDCEFPPTRRYMRVSEGAVTKVDGVESVDPTPALCEGDRCPAVVGDVIVYGQTTHLTATYVKTMTRWLGEQLPD